MRYLAILLTIILCSTVPHSSSASLRMTAAAKQKVIVVHRPVATLKARLGRTADCIAERLVRSFLPDFIPAPGAEDTEAPANKMATVSLICGIVGYLGFWVALPAALITGIIALNQIRDSGERGKSRAVAGIILGGAPIAIAIIVFSWVNGQ